MLIKLNNGSIKNTKPNNQQLSCLTRVTIKGCDLEQKKEKQQSRQKWEIKHSAWKLSIAEQKAIKEYLR